MQTVSRPAWGILSFRQGVLSVPTYAKLWCPQASGRGPLLSYPSPPVFTKQTLLILQNSAQATSLPEAFHGPTRLGQVPSLCSPGPLCTCLPAVSANPPACLLVRLYICSQTQACKDLSRLVLWPSAYPRLCQSEAQGLFVEQISTSRLVQMQPHSPLEGCTATHHSPVEG